MADQSIQAPDSDHYSRVIVDSYCMWLKLNSQCLWYSVVVTNYNKEQVYAIIF